jgi:hypothetical protein
MARRGIAVLGGSIVVLLILAETGLRIWMPIPADRLLPFPYNGQRVRRIADDSSYLTFDRDLGWRLATSRTRRDGNLVYRTNGAAMRADRDYPFDPPGGIQRIAAFGDSFTHCSEVTQADCWVPRLEGLWPGAELLNFGVTAYGPDQAWLRYQRDGRAYRPCAVLIGYFSEDIDRVVNRFRPFIYPDDSVVLSKPRFLLEGSGLRLLPNPTVDPLVLGDPHVVEQTLGDHDAWYFPGTFVEQPLDTLILARLARTAAYQRSRSSLLRSDIGYPLYDRQGEAYELTRRILTEFAAQVRSDGATPIVLVFPGERDLIAYRQGQHPYQPLVSRLVDSGVPTLDLTDLMVGEMEQHGLDRLFQERHYSPTGNGAVAQYLAQALPPLVASTCQPG